MAWEDFQIFLLPVNSVFLFSLFLFWYSFCSGLCISHTMLLIKESPCLIFVFYLCSYSVYLNHVFQSDANSQCLLELLGNFNDKIYSSLQICWDFIHCFNITARSEVLLVFLHFDNFVQTCYYFKPINDFFYSQNFNL